MPGWRHGPRYLGGPWNEHLDALGICALKVHPDPVLIATEGAPWGSVKPTASCLTP